MLIDFNRPVVFLHGFLGTPSDFEALPLWNRLVNRHAPSIIAMTPEPGQPATTSDGHAATLWFQAWVDTIATHIADLCGTGARPVLVGYSLGGRLAMSLIANHPAAYAAAILVSANPGMNDPTERHKRAQQDDYWARRWETEPFDSVHNDWNALPLFGGTPSALRRVSRDQIDKWAQVLRYASPGRIPNRWPDIAQWALPTLWIAGKRDVKYAEMYGRIGSQIAILDEAAHRVPWDAPEVFSSCCERFLRLLSTDGSPRRTLNLAG